MSDQYIGLVIWALGCVSMLAGSWLTDRRENRQSMRKFDELKGLLQDKMEDHRGRIAVLENKIDECLRRVDRP